MALVVSLAAASVAACAEERPAWLDDLQIPEVTLPEVAPAEVRPHARHRLNGLSRVGSTLALARQAQHSMAFIADEDARAIRIVDPENLTEQAAHLLDGKPSQLVVAGDGRLYVALRDKSELLSLELDDARVLRETARWPTPAEPVGLAVSPDGATLAVSAAWGRRLVTLAVPSGQILGEVALAREPRGVAISDDGRQAYVAHAIGSQISRVTLAPGGGQATALALGGSDVRRIHHSCMGPMGSAVHERRIVQGFAIAMTERAVLVPEVLVHPGEEIAVGSYGSGGFFAAHQPLVAQVALDDDSGSKNLDQTMADQTMADQEVTPSNDGKVFLRGMLDAFEATPIRNGVINTSRRDGCLLPRAAAADRTRGTLYVGCQGTDEVLAFDTRAEALAVSARGRWKVPAGVTGIALDEQAGTALIWSQYAGELSVIKLVAAPEDAEQRKIRYPSKPVGVSRHVALGPLPERAPTLSTLAQKGRLLFHGAGNTKLASDGRACASCHPDGRDDGLTWPTPHGPRQTPMLAGRLAENTAPYGWEGKDESVSAHLLQTLKRLNGVGIRDDEIAALVAYCREMPTPPGLFSQPKQELVARGKELFTDQMVGCAVCHTDNGTGSDGVRHNVGSGPDLETPSLAFVAGTGPYFHDGRYATLAQLLADSQGKMGWGEHLTSEDLQALEAYLLTL